MFKMAGCWELGFQAQYRSFHGLPFRSFLTGASLPRLISTSKALLNPLPLSALSLSQLPLKLLPCILSLPKFLPVGPPTP